MYQEGIETVPRKEGIFQWLLNLIYPPKCIFCGALLAEGEGPLCPTCANSLPRTDASSGCQFGEAFSVCLSPMHYQGMLRRSFQRYKFRGQWQYSRVYSRWMIESFARWQPPWRFDLVTWVPLHGMRRRKRGYDQTKLLAQPVARYLELPLTPTLRKRKNITAQSHLTTVDQRWENVKGCFQLLPGAEVEGRRILLIDDLITTGATLEQAASVLMEAGAEEIYCLTLACGAQWKQESIVLSAEAEGDPQSWR